MVPLSAMKESGDQRREHIEASKQSMQPWHSLAHRADQLDGPEQEKDRSGREVRADSDRCEQLVRFIKPREGFVPSIRGAVGDCAGIERDDIESEDGRADPDDGHQRTNRPAQCRNAFRVRHSAEHPFERDVPSVKACHSACSL